MRLAILFVCLAGLLLPAMASAEVGAGPLEVTWRDTQCCCAAGNRTSLDASLLLIMQRDDGSTVGSLDIGLRERNAVKFCRSGSQIGIGRLVTCLASPDVEMDVTLWCTDGYRRTILNAP